MLQKNKNSSKIAFLEEASAEQIPQPQGKPEIRDAFKPSVAQKLDSFDNLSQSKNPEKSILSAGNGSITDTGGPKRFMGSESHNSIWDNDKLKDLKASEDNKEKTLKTTQRIKDIRNEMKQERMNELVEGLQSSDQRKASSVAKIESDDANDRNYKNPTRGISIFDSAEFERVPEKTDGEKSAQNARAARTKDESWKTIKGTVSTKSIVDSLFSKLTGEDSNE
jgi:hypothetical protein